jgi:hypothetical protein
LPSDRRRAPEIGRNDDFRLKTAPNWATKSRQISGPV